MKFTTWFYMLHLLYPGTHSYNFISSVYLGLIAHEHDNDHGYWILTQNPTQNRTDALLHKSPHPEFAQSINLTIKCSQDLPNGEQTLESATETIQEIKVWNRNVLCCMHKGLYPLQDKKEFSSNFWHTSTLLITFPLNTNFERIPKYLASLGAKSGFSCFQTYPELHPFTVVPHYLEIAFTFCYTVQKSPSTSSSVIKNAILKFLFLLKAFNQGHKREAGNGSLVPLNMTLVAFENYCLTGFLRKYYIFHLWWLWLSHTCFAWAPMVSSSITKASCAEFWSLETRQTIRKREAELLTNPLNCRFLFNCSKE